MDYEKNKAGEALRKRDEDRKARELVRFHNNQVLQNSEYNIINGDERKDISYI